MRDTSLAAFLDGAEPVILIEIESVKGSSPREAGTFMLVSKDRIWQTIGGGQFEYMAIDHARAMLSGKTVADSMDIPLGPEIGQCCGGRTLLRFTEVNDTVAAELKARLEQANRAQPTVFIFGAGHVGKALTQAFSLLPVSISIVETRQDELHDLPAGVATHLSPMPEAIIHAIPAGSAVIIVTHDHALDFLIAREALLQPDLAYVGMIGSKTKRATFAHWIERESDAEASVNLERLTLPIGGSTVKDKRPAIIAALVAAEVLHAFHRSAAPVESPPLAFHP
ncbi:xanthine dehydrogenase accessory protein XdhC [Agrobacterium sp. AGB01]|uniref:xanthine dehydrogenase accessory protein XdhC n=1 Tax=Agrobacterium sp. AGB01 TaxID=2769302 RepID=UPI001781A958|nr:xanthine dehydrogenase accessory protein XdhC [Agrobacterium sp. AGB01]MBD9387351.1 xanthine dehydrogenase accessory protein XdhC [Agrobacterium sp. AGB01]